MRIAAFVSGFALIAAPSAEAELQNIQSRPGVTVPIAIEAPSGNATAWVLLLPGGNGRLGLSSSGAPTSDLSALFLIQSRAHLHRAGIGTVMVDTPSGARTGMQEVGRRSAEHATDLTAIVRTIRQRYGRPVWLLGHSNGAVSVAAASRALTGADRPDGLIMTSGTVVRARPAPDSPLAPFPYNGPVLILAHQADGCVYSPPKDQEILLAAFASAKPRVLRVLSGGSTGRGDPCYPMSPHSFVGMHGEVMALIAEFIRSAPPPARR